MLIIAWLDYGTLERLGRTTAHHIVQAVDETPALPRGEQAGDGVGETVAKRRDDDASGRARHALHIAQKKRRGDTVRFARAPTCDNHRGVGANELR